MGALQTLSVRQPWLQAVGSSAAISSFQHTRFFVVVWKVINKDKSDFEVKRRAHSADRNFWYGWFVYPELAKMRPRLLSRDSADIVSATYFSSFLDKTFSSHHKCILEAWVSDYKSFLFWQLWLPAQLNQYNRCRVLRKWSSAGNACTLPIQSTTLSWGATPIISITRTSPWKHSMSSNAKRGIRNNCSSKMLIILQRFHSKRKLVLRICHHHWMHPQDHISEQRKRTNAHN